MARELNSTEEQRQAFSAALELSLKVAGINSIAELLVLLSNAGFLMTDSGVRRWVFQAVEPQRPIVLELERICGLAPGELSRHLGWVPVDGSTGVARKAPEVISIEQAVNADRTLKTADKRIVIDLVKALRDR